MTPCRSSLTGKPDALAYTLRFIEKYLLCSKCQYPETSMYIKAKNLHAKCRACGNDQALDSMHRAGSYLMKQLPKNMSEIDVGVKTGAPVITDEPVKSKKKGKKEEV